MAAGSVTAALAEHPLVDASLLAGLVGIPGLGEAAHTVRLVLFPHFVSARARHRQFTQSSAQTMATALAALSELRLREVRGCVLHGVGIAA